jgi:hypothetical protein
VGQVVIVVSNTSMTNDLKVPEPPKVVAGTKGCPGWRGTMTGTYEWNRTDAQGHNDHGKGTTTFAGLWAADSVDQPIVSCQSPLPDSCIAYMPNGTIHWTWDAHQSSGCSETRAGDFPAGAVNDSRNAGGANGVPLNTQVLVLQPDGNGHYGYWGKSSWSGPTAMACSDGALDYHYPPDYFDISQQSTGSGAADGAGNTCEHTTWQIDVKADTITGSCYAWNNTGSSLMYVWNLKRVGPAPGS